MNCLPSVPSVMIDYHCCCMNLKLNSTQRNIYFKLLILFPLELHLLWTQSLYQLFPDFWKFLNVPIWVLPILDAHPPSRSNLSDTLLLIKTSTYSWASMFLFFSSIWASSVLIPVLIDSDSNKLQFVYLTITSHLACWKSLSIVYNKLLIESKQLLYYTFLFLTEHNPSFTLFLICYFFTQSEFWCSYKACSLKKECR